MKRRNPVSEESLYAGHIYRSVTKNTGEWWIGWIEEVSGVNCQERTYNELIASLRLTLREALAFNRLEALKAAGEGYREDRSRYEAGIFA